MEIADFGFGSSLDFLIGRAVKVSKFIKKILFQPIFHLTFSFRCLTGKIFNSLR